jgi:Cys/Met metabolism PLP-dependent enzyme
MHSATKFIAGHSDLMAGILAVKGERFVCVCVCYLFLFLSLEVVPCMTLQFHSIIYTL